MKKLLLFSSFLLSASASFAQINSYFLNNPIWNETSLCAVPAPCIENDTYNYYTNGDTIINSLQYKKIFRKGIKSRNWQSPNPNQGCSGTNTYVDTVPSFYLRSAGKQIYIYSPTVFNPEQLLYDFNLQVGDTLPLTAVNTSNAITVTAIDSFYTMDGFRKRFHLTGTYTWCMYLLEGVGTDKGLATIMQIPFECGYNLNCYSLQDTGYYPQTGPTCDIPLAVLNDVPEKTALAVYPNPAADILNISLSSGEINTVVIRNLQGSIVSAISGNNKSLPTETLAPGFYFVEVLTTDNLTLRRSFIKK